jgi:hypothetical protein
MDIQQKLALKWRSLLSLTTLSGTLAFSLSPALAGPTPLTSATLRKVVNQVELFLKREALRRDAKVSDRLTNGGDQIDTRKSSRAELKFNDGTIAKVGELATFRFTPNTRRFDLGNGTYLFLVPPGRGSTEFYTPNAKAGVRGSALFIRYIKESDTTIMGALTNNPLGPMDITTGGQKQDLYAGQMAVVIKNRIDRVETFDLKTFLSTSPLYREIDQTDPDLQAVRQEVSDAVTTQVAGNSPIVPAIAVVAPIAAPSGNISDVSSVTTLTSPNVAIVRKVLNGQAAETQEQSAPVQAPQNPVTKPTAPPIQQPTQPENPVTKPPAVPIQQPTQPENPPVVQPEPGTIIDPPVVKPDPRPITDLGHDAKGRHLTYVTITVGGKPVVYLAIDGKIDSSTVIVNPLPAPTVQSPPVVEAAKPAPTTVEVSRPTTVEVSRPTTVEVSRPTTVEVSRPTTVEVVPVSTTVSPPPVRPVVPEVVPVKVIEVVPPVAATPVPTTTRPDVFSPSVVPIPAVNRVTPPVAESVPVVVPPVVVTPTEPVVVPPVVVSEPVVRPTAPAITAPQVPSATVNPVMPTVPVTPTIPTQPIDPPVQVPVTPAPVVPTAPVVVIPTAPVIEPPVIPSAPVAPIVPETPVVPIVPVVISTPVTPVVPEVPVVPAPVVTPVVPPVVPVTPVAPVIPQVPAPAITPTVPVAPSRSGRS